jgi:hypothetical protein
MHRSRKKSEKSSQSSPSVKIILFDLNFIFTDEGVESHRIEWHGINALVTSRARAIHFSRADAVGVFTHVITKFLLRSHLSATSFLS